MFGRVGIWIWLGVFAVLNGYGFFVMRHDKLQAKRRQQRVPEKTLFSLAFLGCGVGTFWAMQRYRHKTQHWSFKLLFPVALVWNLAAYGVVLWLLVR